jgi:acyl carrier protein
MSAKLYNIIAQVMKMSVSEVNDESSPQNIERWDSFHGLVLLNDLEAAFNVKFTLDEVTSIRTVGDKEKSV